MTKRLIQHFGMCAIFLLASFAMQMPAMAQNPQPLAQPNVNLLTSGTVLAILPLADGSTIIGGSFISINGEPRSNIAKRRADGSLDLDWRPSVAGAVVRALATDSAGNIYVGGEFSAIDGVARRNLAKLAPNGALVADWNPSSDDTVEALLVNAAGDVFVGGAFNSIAGQPRSKLAKFSASTGALDTLWNPTLIGSGIRALRLSHDGALYAGGGFSTIGGRPISNIAKLSMSGTGAVDPNWNPSPNSWINDIAVAEDGFVYITGEFWEIRRANGEQWLQTNLAKLSGVGSGSIVEGWDPLNFAPRNGLRGVAVDSNGWLYVTGGEFPSFADGTSSNVVRISTSGLGQFDPSWNPRIQATPYVLSYAGGRLQVGGNFGGAANQVRLGFVSLTADASAEPAFDAEAPDGATFTMATQADGRMIVSGRFAKANGQLRAGLLRLNADGSLDLDWNPAPNGAVRAITFAADGSAIVGGNFSHIGGQSLSGAIAKLSAINGSVDPNWNPGLEGYVRALTTDHTGRVYAGGLFTYGVDAATQRNLCASTELLALSIHRGAQTRIPRSKNSRSTVTAPCLLAAAS